MYNQINISSGHSINCQGMNDVINEVTEARKVVDKIYEICKNNKIECYKYHDTSNTSNANLLSIVNWHNQFLGGLDVSIHFNAYKHTNNAMGVEVLYYSEQTLATNLANNISKVSGLKNRGSKKRQDLYFLKNTAKPAVLVEVCFGDSTTDVDIYKNKFSDICNAIIATITGKPLVQEDKKLWRVSVDNVQVGAYGNFNNVIEQVKKNKDENEIKITRK